MDKKIAQPPRPEPETIEQISSKSIVAMTQDSKCPDPQPQQPPPVIKLKLNLEIPAESAKTIAMILLKMVAPLLLTSYSLPSDDQPPPDQCIPRPIDQTQHQEKVRE